MLSGRYRNTYIDLLRGGFRLLQSSRKVRFARQGGRLSSPVTASMEHGRRGMVLIVEVNRVLIPHGEGDIAENLKIPRHLALQVDCDRIALSLTIENIADTISRGNLLARNGDPQV